MLQNETSAQEIEKQFISKICETFVVYALENQDGFATSSSTNYETNEGEAVGLICFWSDKALAESCISQDWEGYEVAEILLSEFLENWCVGMANDLIMIGADFNTNLFGPEFDPLELILEIVQELNKLGTSPEFEKFDNLSDLEQQVRETLE